MSDEGYSKNTVVIMIIIAVLTIVIPVGTVLYPDFAGKGVRHAVKPVKPAQPIPDGTRYGAPVWTGTIRYETVEMTKDIRDESSPVQDWRVSPGENKTILIPVFPFSAKFKERRPWDDDAPPVVRTAESRIGYAGSVETPPGYALADWSISPGDKGAVTINFTFRKLANEEEQDDE